MIETGIKKMELIPQVRFENTDIKISSIIVRCMSFGTQIS